MSRWLLFLVAVSVAVGHMSIWHPSTFDREPIPQPHATLLGLPLTDMPFSQWWWHGNLAYPPDPKVQGANATFQLKANGVVSFDIFTNRDQTSWGSGYPDDAKDHPDKAPEIWDPKHASFVTGNTHSPTRFDVGGCALGIAYKSDPYQVKPSDFVIFSVEHDCPARYQQHFEVPNLPACPSGKCMCAWFWVHKSVGGGDQIYMSPFVCTVTDVRADAQAVDVANARPPRKCFNPKNCVQGPRNPIYYLLNSNDNNMPEGANRAPTYSVLYGFSNGAQKDIFVNTNPVPNTKKPVPPETPCLDPKLNPNKFSHRLYSDDTARNGIYSPSQGKPDKIISPNCRYHLLVQGDGNLLLIDQQSAEYGGPWGCQCDEARKGGSFKAVLGNDGSFTLSSEVGNIWSSFMSSPPKTPGTGPYRLEVEDNGVVVMFDSKGLNVWESWFFNFTDANGGCPWGPDPVEFPTYSQVPQQTFTRDIPTNYHCAGNDILRRGRGNGGLPLSPRFAVVVSIALLLLAFSG